MVGALVSSSLEVRLLIWIFGGTRGMAVGQTASYLIPDLGGHMAARVYALNVGSLVAFAQLLVVKGALISSILTCRLSDTIL